MKINSQITEAAEKYVTLFLEKNLGSDFHFHNLSHTITVAEAVKEICDEEGTKKHEKNILLVAAWFHDSGYTKMIDQHEDAGAHIAAGFLKSHNIDEADIEIVMNCIIATHYPQYPLTDLEKILCDADLMHLSKKNHSETAGLLRKEWELTRNKIFTDEEWLDLNIQFMTDHSYHTDYGKNKAENRKRKNIQKLLQIKQSQYVTAEAVLYQEDESILVNKKEKKTRDKEFGRGVETLFRVASSNHMRLSGMADNKAHILLSINSIIISVILSVLSKRLSESTYLVLPTLLLLIVCLITIVFAVLTTRPKISRNNISPEHLRSKKVNLLFFGNFHQLEMKTYESGVREMMHDKDYLYNTLTRDIYFIGKVLAVKYRYLNIGYMIFMYGLILSVLSFAISFFFNHQ